MNTPIGVPQPASLDSQTHLVLPPEILQDFGLEPGAQLSLRITPEGVVLRPPLSQLRKIYIEPTSRCNFSCRTCIRNAWGETQGAMSAETFEHILSALKELKTQPSVFFGGFGEPLTHPQIVEMVRETAKLASRV